MQTIKNKLPAKHQGKMISQRNKGHRVKPYETKSVNKQCGPIYSEIPEQQYIAMTACSCPHTNGANGTTGTNRNSQPKCRVTEL